MHPNPQWRGSDFYDMSISAPALQRGSFELEGWCGWVAKRTTTTTTNREWRRRASGSRMGQFVKCFGTSTDWTGFDANTVNAFIVTYNERERAVMSWWKTAIGFVFVLRQ